MNTPNVTALAPREVVALATAMMAPAQRPQYLEHAMGSDGAPIKRSAGYASSIDDAVRSGRPFMVKARHDVLVIDSDGEGELAIEFAREYLDDYVPVACESGRSGHLHLFVKVDEPSEGEYLVRAAKAMGLRDVSMGRWIRPPGAPHTFAAPSVLLDMATDSAVAALASTSQLPQYLGTAGTKALLQGARMRSQASASEALWSATAGMVACGWDIEDMFRCLWMFEGGEKLRRKAHDDRWGVPRARAWWERYVLAKAMDLVANSPTVRNKADALATIDAATAWMHARHWMGTAGGTDRAVLGAVLMLAERSGKIVRLGLACRQVAEEAGVAWTTARVSLQRLSRLGIIERMGWDEVDLDGERHTGPFACRYRIRVPRFETDDLAEVWRSAAANSASRRVESAQSDPGGCMSLTVRVERDDHSDHDAFRRGALGKTAWKAWNALDGQPITTKRLSQRLGYKQPATLRKHLNRLAEVNLATETSDGWVRSGEGDLDAIAARFGTAGQGAGQRVKHSNDRKANDARRRARSSASNVITFLRTQVVSDPHGTITYRQMRTAYHHWCGRRRTPVTDFALFREVERLTPGAPPVLLDPLWHGQNPWARLNPAALPLRILGLPMQAVPRSK